jgi:hypothetical protein
VATVNVAVATVPVTSISLTRTTHSLRNGESFMLYVNNVLPANAANKDVTWSVSNSSRATILQQGDINNWTAEIGIPAGATPGTGNIVATAADGSGITATCVVTVIDGGNGTAANPFRVATAADLQKVGSGIDGWHGFSVHYRQTANIDLSGVSNWTPLGGSGFYGCYDGGGYSISNLKINRPDEDYMGLFGSIMGYMQENDGVIKNVALINVNIVGEDYVGGITGGMGKNSRVENCYVTGSITGLSAIGGISGTMNDAIIRNCYTTCNVATNNTNYSHAGGIVGFVQSFNFLTRIEFCYATGTVIAHDRSGGIAGSFAGGSRVDNCVALNPSVKIHRTAINHELGRVTAESSGSVSNSYARGDMVVQWGSNNKTINSSPGSKDGQSITATQWNASSWWSGTANFNATNWDLGNRLPHLKTTTGAAFNQTQNPTVPVAQ